MDRDTWLGLVSAILAAGVAVALPATLIIVALHPTGTPEQAELIAVISTIAGAAVGAVGAWLGSRRGEGQ